MRLVCILLSSLILATGFAHAEKLKVVTTFTVFADMARNVAGEHAEIISITRPGAEIHNYQPTPGDIRRAQSADLILWNGLNLELWVERFFDNLSDVPSAMITDGIEPLNIGEGPYDGKPNPHAWMSPENGVIYVENIYKALSAQDPDHEPYYRENADAYIAQIRAIAPPIDALLAHVPDDKKWLVTSEGAFSYLAKDFGLKELYIWPINSDQQGTPQQVRKVIDTVRKFKIPAVFSESTVSAKPAKSIANETNAIYGGVLYVDSLSKEGGPVPTYLDLLTITAQTIAKGLSSKP